MVRLTRLNDEPFYINSSQIERIEMIPETKVILANGKHYIVKESADDIIHMTKRYQAEIIAMAEKLKENIVEDIGG